MKLFSLLRGTRGTAAKHTILLGMTPQRDCDMDTRSCCQNLMDIFLIHKNTQIFDNTRRFQFHGCSWIFIIQNFQAHPFRPVTALAQGTAFFLVICNPSPGGQIRGFSKSIVEPSGQAPVPAPSNKSVATAVQTISILMAFPEIENTPGHHMKSNRQHGWLPM